MNRLALLQGLMNELLSAVQAMIESGEEMSDELQGMIAQELEYTQRSIDSIRQAEKRRQAERRVDITQPASADAQLLWVLSGGQEQAFISYLRNFPSAETQAILSNPQRLMQTIDYLNHTMPQGVQPVVNGIPHADLNSSNIWGALYDPRTSKLRVRFQGGSEYEYDGIPDNIWRAFIHGNAQAKTSGKNKYGRWWVGKNPSLGAALNQYVKAGKFNYRKLR